MEGSIAPRFRQSTIGGYETTTEQGVQVLDELGDRRRHLVGRSTQLVQRQLLDLIVEELVHRLAEFVLDVPEHLLNQRVDVQSNGLHEPFRGDTSGAAYSISLLRSVLRLTEAAERLNTGSSTPARPFP